MANINKIQVNGTEYDIQDASAQTAISSLQTSVNGKQDLLTAGDNITIVNNVISSTGGGMQASVENTTLILA